MHISPIDPSARNALATNAPFTAEFVIRETLRHMERCVAVSTQKTIQRMQGFVDDKERNEEAINALASLNRLHNLIRDIKVKNNVE